MSTVPQRTVVWPSRPTEFRSTEDMIRHPVKSKASPWHDEPRPPVLTHKIFALPGRLTQRSVPSLQAAGPPSWTYFTESLNCLCKGWSDAQNRGKSIITGKLWCILRIDFPCFFTCGYVEAAVNFIPLEVLMSRLPFILSLLITSAVLCTPPSVRASLLTYDITATINGGSFNGEGFQAFFTYDTKGDASDQDSPAGVVAPVNVAFTDKDAEINVADLIGGGSTLQVEASNIGNFVFTATYPGAFTLNQPLPVTGGVFTIMFTSGPLSDGVGFTSINLAPSVSVVPEPSSLLLLVSGSLMVLGVCWWRQHHERVTPAAA
jgi:hypothetical protein